MPRPEDRFKIAHFKFGLIAPVIQGTYTDASAIDYYKRITKEPLLRPDGTTFHYKPKSLQHWELLYKKNGMDALITQERKDKGMTRVLSNESISAIYELKNKFPRLNATQVHLKLLEDGIITSKVSVRCIQRFIKEWNLKVGSCCTGSKDRKAFEEEYFGCMWQTDSCYFPHIPDKNGKLSRTYLIAIIDDYSRLIVAAGLFFHDNGTNLQKTLKRAIATYGIPNKLYCDNGSPYINNQTTFICDSIGTLLLHAPVRDGAAKGKIERLFRSIKERWIYGLDISTVKSIDEFNNLLSEQIRKYNLTIHSSTGETPIDRYLKTRDKIKVPISAQWLDECFMHRIKRKVRNDSTLDIEKIQYDVPMQFIGQTVDIRYSPEKDNSVYILYDGLHYPLRKTNKVENANTKRSVISIDYSKTTGGEYIV